MTAELVKRLRVQGNLFWNGNKDERIAGMLMQDAATIIERLTAPQQWIAVSERKPEHENDVLIHHVLGDDARSNRAYDVACYIGGAWVFPWGKEISPHWVTHWMPLPAAPAAERPDGEGKG